MHLNFVARSLGLVVSALTLAALARAGDIVNTGPGPNTVPGWGLGKGVQSLAAQFTLTSTQQVSAIYGWIGDDYFPDPSDNTPGENDTGGVLDVSILSGDINLNNVVFAGSTNIAVGSAPNWYGPSSLNLTLGPGTYWVEFSGDVAYDSPGGFLGYMPFNVPNPLDWYDFNQPGFTTGFAPFPLDFGVKIESPGPNTVPDNSGTALLLGSGLVGVALARRARRLQV